MYETLLTREEFVTATDMGNFYRVPADTRDLNYNSFFVEGDMKVSASEKYNSNNTRQLNVEEIKEKLGSLKYVRNELAEWRSRR